MTRKKRNRRPTATQLDNIQSNGGSTKPTPDGRYAGKIALICAAVAGAITLVTAFGVPLVGKLTEGGRSVDELVSIDVMTDPSKFSFGSDDKVFGTVNGFLFPKGRLTSIPKPTEYCYAWHDWAHRNGGVDIERTSIAMNVAPLTDASVQVLGAQLLVESIENPGGDEASCDQGDPTTASHLKLDLDERTATYTRDGSEPTPLSLTITRDSPERIYVHAWSAECYCKWRLELQLLIGRKRHSYMVDNNGRPFVTAPRKSYSSYLFDGKDWIHSR
ncbi:hypothetical protein AB0I92_11235 [Micromonospora chalcea]|uniref:hypothetical protein n=1 Tax=Micromonospora chalcea TaxID=1874 RepID=UPI00340298D3